MKPVKRTVNVSHNNNQKIQMQDNEARASGRANTKKLLNKHKLLKADKRRETKQPEFLEK